MDDKGSPDVSCNDDKTEFLVLGTRQQLAQKVDISSINAQSAVRNLRSLFDNSLSMSTHISKVCAAAFYRVHNISRVRKFLIEDTKTLIHAFISTRSLLYGLRMPASHLHKSQRVLNAAARLICSAPRHCHIMPLLCDLHCIAAY